MSDPSPAVDPSAETGPVDWPMVLRLARRLPEVEEGTWFRTPCLRVRKKSFARLKEDGETLVVGVNYYERQYLMDAEPGVFSITDHYRDHPYMLVRLAAVTPAQLSERLEEAWRLAAPKRLVDAFDARG
jgi:hypothetical protein